MSLDQLKVHFRNSEFLAGNSLFSEGKVSDLNFIRRSYWARVHDGKKIHNPELTFDKKLRLHYFFCSCDGTMRKGALCRHLAALICASLIPQKKVRTNETRHVPLNTLFQKSFYESFANLLFLQLAEDDERNAQFQFKDKSTVKLFLFGNNILTVNFPEGSTDIKSLIYGFRGLKDFPFQYTNEEKNSNKREERILLRSMKRCLDGYETNLDDNGLESSLMRYERSSSMIFAKGCFLHFGGEREMKIVLKQNRFIFSIEKDLKITFLPEKQATSNYLGKGKKWIFQKNGFEFPKEKGKSLLKLEFDKEHNLRLLPSYLFPSERKVLLKSDLNDAIYGNFLFFPNKVFREIPPPRGFFAQKLEEGDNSLFESANTVSSSQETLIPAQQVFAFLTKHQQEIEGFDERLVPPSIRNKDFEKSGSAVRLHLEKSSGSWTYLSIIYEFKGEEVDLQELLEAKMNGERVKFLESCCVDLEGHSLAWLNEVKAFVETGGRMKMRTTDYLRVLNSLDEETTVHFSGDSSLMQKFQAIKENAPQTKPPELGLQLRDYQQQGYDWLWFLYENSLGGILADDMGLGKTLQSLSLLLAAFRSQKRELSALVLCPASLLYHWETQVKNWTPELTIAVYHGTKRSFDPARSHITITTYETLRNDVGIFSDHEFNILLLDEIQRIKNKASANHIAVQRLKAQCKVGLSGTPVENRLLELKGLFDILLPGYLGEDKSFKKTFSIPIEDFGDEEAMKQLQKLITPFVLRRKKSEVLKELPKKIEEKRYCYLTDEQSGIYKGLLKGRGDKYARLLKNKEEKIPYLHIFAFITYLKQLCDHPALLKEEDKIMDENATSGKWELFKELLEEAINSGFKIVVYSQYMKMLDIIEAYLSEKEIGFTGIRGKTATEKRGEILEEFKNNPDCRVFVASLKAGGVGIDLTAASVVIHYDRWWHKAQEDQATDRVHRLGQNQGVQVFKLITKGTLEEKIDEIISQKGVIAETLLDGTLDKMFSPDELLNILESNHL